MPTKIDKRPNGNKNWEIKKNNFIKTKEYNFTKTIKKDNLGTMANNAVTS